MRTDPLPIVGVELGARMESTALSVTERAYVPTGESFNKAIYDNRCGWTRLVASEKISVQYRVRHLERRSAPVRYKGVAERVGELVKAVGGECLLVVLPSSDGAPSGGCIESLLRSSRL